MFIKEKENLELVSIQKSREKQNNEETVDLYPAVLAQEISRENNIIIINTATRMWGTITNSTEDHLQFENWKLKSYIM